MLIQDYQGRQIRLPDERWQHIISGHDEMTTMLPELQETLEQPERLMIPGDETEAERRYYKWFENTIVGDKWMRVAVKYLKNDAYVLTAFMTKRVK